ncbi:MAG: SH3 domain-containing protein [Lachnospiraceae bacterium]|nr:SH3 domain-containing protein [Lachnospiraceae bacterium]
MAALTLGIAAALLAVALLAVMAAAISPDMSVLAKGTTYTTMSDVYYTKDNCVVYAEPDYNSQVITTIGANIPVQVVGAYSNGWYRINIGVICYVKMDSLTTAGAIGLPTSADDQIAAAQQIASDIGYEFVYLSLNDEMTIKKDIFNSYISQKVILYVKLDDEIGISFKMLYEDKVKSDINLTFTKSVSINDYGDRVVEIVFDDATELWGQIAIFQFKEGYDKAVTINTTDLDTYEYVEMNTYYTEFSQFAYAPVTQVADMKIVEAEITNSLTQSQREKMTNIQRGIKYKSYDNSEYRSSIHSRLRKDTEYVDYEY